MNTTMFSKLILKYKNKYENNQNKKKYKIKIIRQIIPADADLSSVLGKKRSYDNAFTQETYDDYRYRQHISIKFFEKNIGHTIIQA